MNRGTFFARLAVALATIVWLVAGGRISAVAWVLFAWTLLAIVALLRNRLAPDCTASRWSRLRPLALLYLAFAALTAYWFWTATAFFCVSVVGYAPPNPPILGGISLRAAGVFLRGFASYSISPPRIGGLGGAYPTTPVATPRPTGDNGSRTQKREGAGRTGTPFVIRTLKGIHH